VVLVLLAREAGDHIGAEREQRGARREPLDGACVARSRVPVAPHASQHAVGAGLQRRVQMWRDPTRCAAQQLGEAVVHFGRLDRRQTVSDAWHVAYEAFDERAERGAMLASPAADVHSREHDLAMMLGERARFHDKFVRAAAAVHTARERRRAESAVLVAPVLDPQERARAGLMRRTRLIGRAESDGARDVG
jgi:hypothetical protein